MRREIARTFTQTTRTEEKNEDNAANLSLFFPSSPRRRENPGNIEAVEAKVRGVEPKVRREVRGQNSLIFVGQVLAGRVGY
jgi:hypothetical protein